MPEIDVNDILTDDYIAGEGFWVYRRAEVMGTNGRSSLEGAWLPAEGSIFPSGDNSLARQEAFSNQANAVTVVTPFRLQGVARTAAGQNYQPDLVYYEGDFYLVRDLRDWSKYGAGFMEAGCTLFNWNTRPPEPPSPVPGEADFSKARNSGLIPAVVG